MLVETVYDVGNPDLPFNAQMLLLSLEKEFELELPNGDMAKGILKGVDRAVDEVSDGRLVTLTLEIDDGYFDMFNPPVNEEFVPARYSYEHIEGYCI